MGGAALAASIAVLIGARTKNHSLCCKSGPGHFMDRLPGLFAIHYFSKRRNPSGMWLRHGSGSAFAVTLLFVFLRLTGGSVASV